MTLTPTEQQAVKEAALRYAKHSNTNTGQYGSLLENMKKWSENDFNAGVQYALSTLFEPRCAAFAEWVHKNTLLNESTVNQWCYKGEYYTTSELFSIYNEQLNKQQDEPV